MNVSPIPPDIQKFINMLERKFGGERVKLDLNLPLDVAIEVIALVKKLTDTAEAEE